MFRSPSKIGFDVDAPDADSVGFHRPDRPALCSVECVAHRVNCVLQCRPDGEIGSGVFELLDDVAAPRVSGGSADLHPHAALGVGKHLGESYRLVNTRRVREPTEDDVSAPQVMMLPGDLLAMGEVVVNRKLRSARVQHGATLAGQQLNCARPPVLHPPDATDSFARVPRFSVFRSRELRRRSGIQTVAAVGFVSASRVEITATWPAQRTSVVVDELLQCFDAVIPDVEVHAGDDAVRAEPERVKRLAGRVAADDDVVVSTGRNEPVNSIPTSCPKHIVASFPQRLGLTSLATPLACVRPGPLSSKEAAGV